MGKYTDALRSTGARRLRTADDPEDPDHGDPTYQDRVDEEKRRIAGGLGDPFPPASQLAALYRDARAEKEALKDRLKEVQLRLTAIEQLVDERYEADGIRSLTLVDDGSQVRIDDEPYAKVRRELVELADGTVGTGKDELREWALASGLRNSLTLPWPTLNSLCKQLLLQGHPPPPGVDVWIRPKLTWVRGKKEVA